MTAQGSGFAVTWTRFADAAPKVERTLARRTGQGPEFTCKGPELLCTTTEQAVRRCGRLCPSSEFAVREPRLLVTTREFTRTDSEILVKGSEQPAHSSDSASNGGCLRARPRAVGRIGVAPLRAPVPVPRNAQPGASARVGTSFQLERDAKVRRER